MKFLYLFLFISALSCSSKNSVAQKSNFSLRFLDVYVIPDTSFENTRIGGLSGIDYNGKEYFLICDQNSKPRFYEVSIPIRNKKIDTVLFKKVVHIKRNNPFLKGKSLDMEGIRYNKTEGNLIVSSEGSIKGKKDPAIFKISTEGQFINHFELPQYFKANNKNHPRNNGVFEGITLSADGRGLWAATELPLLLDGAVPTVDPTISPVRITYFDKQNRTAERQFIYLLDPIAKAPLLPFSINGVSAILALESNKFLVVERGYSAGYGRHGNTVKIFLVDASNATNTLDIPVLKNEIKNIKTADKKLLFDFDSVSSQFPYEAIDNIEGISFGPTLSNGNKSLLLIADNNFNSMGPQMNQVILLEIVDSDI